MSRVRSSTKPVPRASRHWSAASGTGPKRASARVRASTGLRPAAMCFCVSRSMWNASSSSSSRSTRLRSNQGANPQEQVAEVHAVC